MDTLFLISVGFNGNLQIESEVLKLIAALADGDCRVAFNTLEV
jgi:replication-associated recombination protein RarA